MLKVSKYFLLILAIVLPIYVDQINGFLISKQLSLPVSQYIKAVYLAIFLFYVLKHNRYIILYSTWFVVLGITLINAATVDGSPDIYKNVVFYTKLLTFPLAYHFLCHFYPTSFSFHNRFGNKIILIIFGTIFIAMFLSLFGIGLPMYGTAISESGKEVALGYRGYFIAGNELSVLYLLMYTFSFYYAFSSKRPVLYLIIVASLGLVTALLIATKTVLLAFIIITFTLPLLDRLYFRIPCYKLTRKESVIVKVFFALGLLGFIYGFFAFQDSIKAKVDFIMFNYEKAGDLITMLTSGRNERLGDSLSLFNNEYTFIQKLFGTGWEYPQKRLIQAYQSDGSAEVDWLDLLVSTGVVGVVWIYSFWILFLFRVYYSFRKQLHQYSVPLLLSSCILFLNSFISGHVMYSSLLGLYLGYLGGVIAPVPQNHGNLNEQN